MTDYELDRKTPEFQSYMDRLNKIEQAIVYNLSRGVFVNNKTSYYITTKVLSRVMRKDTKILSVYLKNLVDKKVISFKTVNIGMFKYKVISSNLREWLMFRNKMPPFNGDKYV